MISQRRFSHLLLIAMITFVALLSVSRDGRTQSPSEPLVLERADSSEVIRVDNETEYQLYGDVNFLQGDTRLRGDRAIWRREAGVINFDGHVLIQQPNRWISAQYMTYARSGQNVLALGDVRLEDSAQSLSLYSQRARYDRSRDLAVADSFPVVYWDFLLDSALQTVVRADTITYDRLAAIGIGTGNVKVDKGEWQASGQYGVIWPDSNYAMLTGQPKASGAGGTISGDTLFLTLSETGVRHVRAVGHATGTYRDTTPGGRGSNLLRGNVADFYVEDDTLRAIRVVGQAYTDYQPADSTEGANHASGDSLWLRFEGGRLSTVTIGGGAQGEYVSGRPSGGADTVDYKAATIHFHPDSNKVDLNKDGQLKYGTIVLDAGQITFQTDKRSLVARGLKPSDTAATIQRPRLTDGKQTIEGEQLTYNIDTQRGRIRGSVTEFEGAYYRGGDFRKYTDSVFFVTDGIYTTCELDPPHFRFESRDMMVIRNDKVIARPVVLKIHELPVALLPYYIFPIRRGRHSGFLPLRFGNFQQGQRFIGNAGYYWAASDYWDVEAALDFNETSGILLRSTVNYALRYRLSGNVSVSYARESRTSFTGLSKTTRWSVRGAHRQTLSPTASLSGNADFVSDKSFYQNYSFDPSDRRLRTVRSQLNFNKRWKGASLTTYAENTENLDTDALTRRLPHLDFQMYSRSIFAPDSGQAERWYHAGRVSYTSRLSNLQTRNPVTVDSVVTSNEKRHATADQTASLSFPLRLFRYVSLAPNASLHETWYYIFDSPLADSSNVPIDKPARRLAGSLGISTNTNLYGFIRPRLLGISAIRHTMTPRIGYSFTPAVTTNDEYRAFTGLGGGSSRRSQLLSFSLSNVFDAKLFEAEREKKLTLLNFGLSTSYNLEAERRKWSTLSGNAHTNINRLDLSVDATWDLYNQQSLKLQWTNPTLLNFGISARTSFRGGVSPFTTVTAVGENFDEADSTAGKTNQLPFNISLSYRYSESRSHASGGSRDHWTDWRVDITPTKNWTVQYQQTYNWARHVVTDQRIALTRNLHCWEARFLWVPTGSGSGYFFKLGVKALPDLRIERSESGVLGAFGRRF